MKIYVSATYRDLQKHREAVAVILRRMGHQTIGMEDYVAEGTRPLHRCLADVASCDVYVGIIAWRYGYVPTDAGAPDAKLPDGAQLCTASITEFELRQAVQSKKPVLLFLLDPEAAWPSNQFDALSAEGDQGRAVARLRQEVTQQYLVSYFRTPEDLASLVSAAVYRAEMSQHMHLESLTLGPKLSNMFTRFGPVMDSTLMEIKSVIGGPQEFQALQINVGTGEDWWMTRLYFLSSLAVDLASVEMMVFLSGDETFLGIAHPEIVRDRLARAYPVLQEYEKTLGQSGQRLADVVSEVDRRAQIWTTQMGTSGGEPSVFVTKRELARWLGPYFLPQAIDWRPGDNAALQMQRLMDWPMRFVPVVEQGRFARIVDREALAEQVARLFLREQVSRALSMTR